MGKSQVTLKYGKGKTSITLDTNNLIQVIEPREIEVVDEESEIVRALNDPIGTPTLHEIASQRKGPKKDLHVVVIVSDVTLSLIHISEPTRRTPISYAVFCLKNK